MSNASEFTEPNGTVSVTLSFERDECMRDENSDLEMGLYRTRSGCRSACFPWLSFRNVHADTHRLLITVDDTGIGISKILEPLKSSSPELFTDLIVLPLQENQLKLFKGTIQFQPGALQKGQGAGLGLFSGTTIAVVCL